jgi:DNA-binding NarL/FixJ family response regulator
VTSDASGLLKALEAQAPDLVLLDADALGSETPLLVETIRARQPACRCILLVRGEREAREATGLGATEVLVKGLPAGHLFEAVERVLAWPNSTTDELEPA